MTSHIVLKRQCHNSTSHAVKKALDFPRKSFLGAVPTKAQSKSDEATIGSVGHQYLVGQTGRIDPRINFGSVRLLEPAFHTIPPIFSDSSPEEP